MSANANTFYQAYLDLEALQVRNAAAAAQAAEQRVRHNASVDEANSKERQRHTDAVALTTKQYQSAATTSAEKTTLTVDALDQQFNALGQSASSKGAIAAGGFTPNGQIPTFTTARALDKGLGELIESKLGIERTLAQLRLQLEQEAKKTKATTLDQITLAIVGAGLLLAILAGANPIAAVALISAATIMQFRLGRRPSALINKRSINHPNLVTDTRARSGFTRKLAGCYILVGLTITALVSAELAHVFPFWSRMHLWRWIPAGSYYSSGEEPLNGIYMWLLFWPTYVYGIFLLISGFKRSARTPISIPTQQVAGGYTTVPSRARGSRGAPAVEQPAGETDSHGNPLQWRPVLKHEWVNEALRDPERFFPTELRTRVHQRAGRHCEAVYYDPFRTEWMRCASPSQESDHIYPHAIGGRSISTNAQALCQKCNVQKGALVPTAAYVAALQHSRQGYFPGGESPIVRKS
ncbi:HNH endonuclease [Jonesiaceae bacterium BS-20]|uniref:HNH endonuclease n=1 Tax=Jonesiaceae bacterium BS-20 TaxID=3120821 RepID=A0AAU7DWQ6_9MICO